MGLNWQYIKLMDQRGILARGMKVLDIGSSNLYSADAGELAAFLMKYSPDMPGGEVETLSRRLAAGSRYDPIRGGLNESFAGELFEAAGMDYLSFDIAQGYKTEVIDFNREPLPERHRGAFDLVVNFGTTEHILHQYNSFKVIHEATKPGGRMWHQLPAIGFTDHCYFTYTGRFFFELAGYNEYRLEEFWFSVGGESRLLDSVRSFSSYYPQLTDYLNKPGSAYQPVEDFVIPNVAANVVVQKVNDRPFMGALERSTSVGVIPTRVMDAYFNSTEAGPEAVVAPRPWRGVRSRLRQLARVVRARSGSV